MQLEVTVQCLVGYATDTDSGRRNCLVFKSRKAGTPAVSPNAGRPNAQVHLGLSAANY